MLYDSYIDSERYVNSTPCRLHRGVRGSNIWSVTHTGFLVATNIKIRQGVRYETYVWENGEKYVGSRTPVIVTNGVENLLLNGLDINSPW